MPYCDALTIVKGRGSSRRYEALVSAPLRSDADGRFEIVIFLVRSKRPN